MLHVLSIALLVGAAVPVPPPVQGADELWEAGRRIEALEAMERELAQRPADAELRARLARREMEVRRFAAALEHASALGPELDPLRGRALYFLGRYEGALPYLDPDDRELFRMRAESLRALGRLDELEALIPRAVEHFGPDEPWVVLLRARRAERAGDAEVAIELFREAAARDPLSSEARFGLGRALVRAGRRDEGLQVLEAHRELVPLLDALDFAQRGVDLAPLHAANHAAVGDAWRALAGFDPAALGRAEACYARAAELAEGDAVVAVALRHARLALEDRADVDAALRVLEAALRRAPDPRLHVRAADALAEAGRRAEAERHLRAALELRPGDEAILERLRALGRSGG